tara:strand:- start:43 stop:171 length:129 start_codon:yes stop_codon:yes gene_type:complete
MKIVGCRNCIVLMPGERAQLYSNIESGETGRIDILIKNSVVF